MAARISSPVFVGRGDELQRLQAVLERARAGVAGTVIVGGEAGVGKTRLLSELRARAEAGGLRVLGGACVDLGDGAPPYDPLVAALRPWLKAMSAADFGRIVGPARSAVLQLIPDLEPDGQGESPTDPAASASQSTLYLQVLGLIERIAADAPTVIALEDLHWSDRSTRDMLRFLVRNLTDARVVLIGTYRTDELTERHPFLTLLAELGRSGQVERVELTPFTPDEVHDQLAGILGRPPGRALVDRLHARGGGNAFFTEELLAVEQRGEQRLGLTLHETLRSRVGGLSTAARAVLRVVAVAGQSARYDVLALVTRMDQAEMAAALRETIDRNLLLAGEDEVMRFRHGLLREAAYDELLPGERLTLHAAVAAAVETVHAGLDVDAAVASELAHHWHQARDGGRALPALVHAGRAAEGMFAFGNAYAHYHLALDLWPATADTVDGLTRLDLTMRAAESAALTGAYRRAIELVQAALDAESTVALDPILAGKLLERLAVYHLGSGNPDAAQPAALRALDLLPVDPPSVERAQVLGVLAQALGLKCHFTESNRIAEEALSTARTVGSSTAEIRALGCIGRNATAVGEADEGVRTLREALALARSVGDFPGAAEICVELALALHWAGDLDQACRVADEGIAESGRWGAEGFGSALRAIRGVSAFHLGRWSEADEWIAGALERDPVGSHGVLAHGARALLDLGRGSLDSAAEHLEIVLLMCRAFTATAYGWTDLYSSIALLSIARGQPSDAIDSVRDSLARSAEPARDVHMRVCHRLAIRAAADLAQVARPIADAAGLAEALAIGREFDGRFDEHAQLVRALPGGGDAHLTLDAALVKAELSRLTGASSATAWAIAAAAADDLRHPYEVAYSRFRQAEALLLGRGSRAAAQAAAVEAHQIASELGAAPLKREIERLALRSRLDLARPAAVMPAAATGAVPAGRAVPFRLTPRELDVLERLTVGRTNREIATDLFISEKTASVHVSNIKSKLGANGRAEIAAIAVRLGLVPDSAEGDEMTGPIAGGPVLSTPGSS
ncbi:MAG TPA: AAA family ATPase [Candidatus Limnocylindrales bacterium]|jgi:DNA-binding CsgD family transcriptional regulator/tetratricopeptide (TPR) repeat protein